MMTGPTRSVPGIVAEAIDDDPEPRLAAPCSGRMRRPKEFRDNRIGSYCGSQVDQVRRPFRGCSQDQGPKVSGPQGCRDQERGDQDRPDQAGSQAERVDRAV